MANRYMDDLSKDVLIDLRHGMTENVDLNQQKQIMHLTKHVRVLWNHVERLEAALKLARRPAPPNPNDIALTSVGAISLKTGSASITLKPDGSIHIKGKDIVIDGSGDVKVKASREITLKGSKIAQN